MTMGKTIYRFNKLVFDRRDSGL